MAKAKIGTIDPDCWDRLKQGDPAALGELYDSYIDKLFLVATGFTDQRELARDALQEVFIELWKYRASLGDIQYPLAYLTKVLRSILIRKLKKEFPKKYLPIEETLVQLENHEDHNMTFDEGSEITARLNHAMSSLTTRQKLIIRLHYYEGLSYEQIAEKLRMNYQSVNNLAFRTIRHLRSLMTSLF